MSRWNVLLVTQEPLKSTVPCLTIMTNIKCRFYWYLQYRRARMGFIRGVAAACTYIYVYIHIHTCMHACMHACIHTYTYVCTYVRTYIHTYIHTYNTELNSGEPTKQMVFVACSAWTCASSYMVRASAFFRMLQVHAASLPY